MTDTFSGVIVSLKVAPKPAYIKALRLIRFVAGVEQSIYKEEPVYIVVFERQIREDDFRDGVKAIFDNLNFAKKVEPLVFSPTTGLMHAELDFRKSIYDLIEKTYPKVPDVVSLESALEFCNLLFAWDKNREKLLSLVKTYG